MLDVYGVSEAVLDVLLPARCLACGRPARPVCPSCASELRPAPRFEVPAGLDSCTGLVAYDGAGRSLVHGLKYRNRRGGVRELGAALAAAHRGPAPAMVTWAPTSAARRRRRGYDQAELLARAVARAGGWDAGGVLGRAPGLPQTGKSSWERRDGPDFAAHRPVPRHVVVVDDVLTTGATLAAAARALRAAGAAHVTGLVLAVTPKKAAPRPARWVPAVAQGGGRGDRKRS